MSTPVSHIDRQAKDADIRLPGFCGSPKLSILGDAQLPPSYRRQLQPKETRGILRHADGKLFVGVPEAVFFPDGRRRVPDTVGYPFSTICSLQITNRNQEAFYGTGFLAGPRLVLTAGHNVFYHGEGFMEQIVVYPGLNGDRDAPPLRSATCSRFTTVEAWVKAAERQFDIGAIYLPTPLGEEAGWLSTSRFTPNTLRSMTVSVAGYPKNPPDADLEADGSTMWCDSGRLTVEHNVLRYTIDTTLGQSGSPIFAHMPQHPDPFHAVGIHNWAFDAMNMGTRINASVFAQIKRWRAESES